MAYVPSLNDGRINATIAGNTAGVGTLVSTGTMTLVGGNNITLSQNGNAITISAPNTPTGSINFSASNTSANLASVTFSNSNGVSFGLTNGTITASHNGITSQTNQTLGLYGTGNTFNNTSLTADARSLSFSGMGNVSIGYSNGMVRVSGSGGGVALYDGANSISSGTALISAGGALTASVNGQTLSLSVPAVSTVNAAGIINISSNASSVTISAPAFSAGIASNSTVTNQMLLTAGNNITLSQSTNATGATVTVSAAAQSNQVLTMSAISNTTGQSATGTLNASAMRFRGMGNVSVGYSASSFIISGGGGVALYDGAASISSGTARISAGGALTASVNGQTLSLSVPATSSLSATGAFSISTNGSTISMGAPAFSAGIASNSTVTNQMLLTAGNNITLSQSTNATGATVTVSAASQSVQTLGFYATGNTTNNTSATFDARSVTFNGLGNIKVGYTNGSVQISGAGGGNSLVLSTTNKTSDYTVTTSDAIIFVNATSGNVTITLPAANSASGYQFTIKRTDGSANTVTIACTGGDTIDGSATYSLDVQYMALSVASNGTIWYIV